MDNIASYTYWCSTAYVVWPQSERKGDGLGGKRRE